jgi:N-acetylmuramoyl-L-alanine amidase
MNVKYATDKNWAKKIAKYMVQIEEVLNNMAKDYEGHWAEAAIKKVIADGLMSGYKDGSFKPDRNVTRAELASTLVRLIEKLK